MQKGNMMGGRRHFVTILFAFFPLSLRRSANRSAPMRKPAFSRKKQIAGRGTLVLLLLYNRHCTYKPEYLQQLYPYSSRVFQHLLDFCGQVDLPARAIPVTVYLSATLSNVRHVCLQGGIVLQWQAGLVSSCDRSPRRRLYEPEARRPV